MAEIMQGGEIFKLIGTTVCTDHTGNEEKFPTYIRISSCSGSEGVIVAKAGDAFLQIGSIGYRDPDDRYNITTHKTYIQIPTSQVAKKTKLTEDEVVSLKNVGEVFADKFKRYIDEGGTLPR